MEYLLVLFHVALIWMLAVATPGANVLLTINAALNYERRVAVFSAFGVSCATLLWAFFGGSGLVLLLSHFPSLFGLMKLVGGSYLLYLGIRQIYLTRKIKRIREDTENIQSISLSKQKVFSSAFITSILNPKTGFFVVSLFSISIPENMNSMLLLAIMLTMSLITLSWHLFLAFVFSHQSAKNVYARVSGQINYITGGLFAAFGVKVMTS
ncbi:MULTISPECIES: LysE family transporter [Photobacterium]|uniref:LysE family translocator n=1 Tax=Photobacterium TaxID=657 RepID=UPI002E18A5F8|nr:MULTISPECIES: LysE family transporter [Photobacterium]MEC6797279.1 LysE family transporter [Photobacterium sp. S4TG1]MEC6906691.1 LysE family transporter [Photobacterium piscicola]